MNRSVYTRSTSLIQQQLIDLAREKRLTAANFAHLRALFAAISQLFRSNLCTTRTTPDYGENVLPQNPARFWNMDRHGCLSVCAAGGRPTAAATKGLEGAAKSPVEAASRPVRRISMANIVLYKSHHQAITEDARTCTEQN
jgi:hypothetical protein